MAFNAVVTIGKALAAETLRYAAPSLFRKGSGALNAVGTLFNAGEQAMTDGAIRVATSTALRLYEERDQNSNQGVELADLKSKKVLPRSTSSTKAPKTNRVLSTSQIRTVNRKKIFGAALVIGQITAGIGLIALALSLIAIATVMGAPIMIPAILWIGIALIANGCFTSHLEEQFSMDKFTDNNKKDAFHFFLATPLASLFVIENWLTDPNASDLQEARNNN